MSNVYLPPYLIRKHEVTFREYLEFWNSLNDPVLKKKCLGWYRFDLNSGGSRPIWNEDGVLNPPFAPELPVIGITLPFFSYGGSSIMTMYVTMGIVSGIRIRSRPNWLKDQPSPTRGGKPGI